MDHAHWLEQQLGMIERLGIEFTPSHNSARRSPCLAEQVSSIAAGRKPGQVYSTGWIDDANIDNPVCYSPEHAIATMQVPHDFLDQAGILCLPFLNVLLLSCSDEPCGDLGFDTVIENGTVTTNGRVAYSADVFITDGNLVRIGQLEMLREQADAAIGRRIDASGRLIAPGFMMCTPTGILCNAAIREFSRAGGHHDNPCQTARAPIPTI